MAEIVVREGEVRDLPWLVGCDGHVGEAALQAKIETAELVVAEIGGERVGMLRLDSLWSEVPFVALVRVAEPFRRRGVGRALISFVRARARERGAAVLLSSTTEGEAEPLAWHHAVGFVECGRIDGINEDGVGEVVLGMRLE